MEAKASAKDSLVLNTTFDLAKEETEKGSQVPEALSEGDGGGGAWVGAWVSI